MPNGQLLETDALDQLSELDPSGANDVVRRVLSTYERTLLKSLREFETAQAASDWPAMGRVAHTLRSSSASVGAKSLAAVCREVEVAIREGRTGGLHPRLLDLQTTCQLVSVAVRQLMVAKGYAS